MITALIGDNTFERQAAVTALIAAFDGVAERIDGSTLTVADLPDLLMGRTLFAEQRLVIITDLALNTTIWGRLTDWLDRVAETTHLVLVDEKPDKRTAAYKALKAGGVIKEFVAWTDRHQVNAENWLRSYAVTYGVTLDTKLAHHVVARVGVDQWQLVSAVEKLSLLDEITIESIDEHIDPNPSENVFQVFELALERRLPQLQAVLRTLELTEEPYKLFALLSSQAVQLLAVALDDGTRQPAKDFGIPPFVVSKLARQAKRLGPAGARRVVKAFADADADMKRSRGEPWLLIERALIHASQA